MSRASEISADRAGFLGSGDIENSLKAMFKIASGLSEKHLTFNFSSYLDQLRELKMIMNTFDIPEGIENNFELGKDAIDNIDDPNHRFYVLQTSSALANHFDSLSQKDSDYAKLRTLTTSLHNRLSGVYNYSTSAFGYGGNWGNGNRIQTKATKSRPTSTFRKSLLPGT